jgi:hypothetical protein
MHTQILDPEGQRQLPLPLSCDRTQGMKTVTEFSGFWLRDALAKTKEIETNLASEGKTAEELAAAKNETLASYLTERYKLEGDRLALFLQALAVAGAKPKESENLKRVVVYGVTEGEKIPSHLRMEGAHAFGPEYLPPVRGSKPQDRRGGDRPGKPGDKKGKRRGGKGRRRPDGNPERRGANQRKPQGAPQGKPNSPATPSG